MSNVPRSYDSSKRKLKAQQNRDEVLKVSKHLFERQGFGKTSIEQIAKESKLAKPTIYALFKSKEGILLAIMDGAFSKEAFADLVKAAAKGETAEERFIITAKICRQLYVAESFHLASLKSLSGLSPELKKMEKQMEERRYLRQKNSIKQMIVKGLINPQISEKKARDTIWALTGRDFFRMLVLERKWRPSEYEQWVAQILLATLGVNANKISFK